MSVVAKLRRLPLPESPSPCPFCPGRELRSSQRPCPARALGCLPGEVLRPAVLRLSEFVTPLAVIDPGCAPCADTTRCRGPRSNRRSKPPLLPVGVIIREDAALVQSTRINSARMVRLVPVAVSNSWAAP